MPDKYLGYFVAVVILLVIIAGALDRHALEKCMETHSRETCMHSLYP